MNNSAFDSGALRTFEDLREMGERGRAVMKSLADAGVPFARALAAEGMQGKERAKEMGRLSHTLDFLSGEDALEQLIEATLSRFEETIQREEEE